MAIYMRMRPESGTNIGKVNLSVDCGKDCGESQPLDAVLSQAKTGEWTEVLVKLSCFAEGSSLKFVRAPFVLETSDEVKLTLSDVKLVANEGQAICLK
jgi:beta-glucosidase